MIRRTPLRRKLPTPRRASSPRCTVRGCRLPSKVTWGWDEQRSICLTGAFDFCVKHARREADRLWSSLVRTGECELAEWHESLGVKCGGPIVACHGFEAAFYPGTRWILLNGFSGCSGVNNWMRRHPLEWDSYLRSAWGEMAYEEMRRRAVGPFKPDYAEIIRGLHERLGERG